MQLASLSPLLCGQWLGLPPRAPALWGWALRVADRWNHQPFISSVVHPSPSSRGSSQEAQTFRSRQRQKRRWVFLPVPVVRGQIPPGGAGAQNPEHGVDETAVILGRPACLALAAGEKGFQDSHTRSEISWRRCAGATATAGIAQSCCTNCNISLLSHSHFDDTP